MQLVSGPSLEEYFGFCQRWRQVFVRPQWWQDCAATEDVPLIASQSHEDFWLATSWALAMEPIKYF
jgi:hypothetical protein